MDREYHLSVTQIILILLHVVYNKENLKGMKQTNKYGRGTERHLPKTDERVVRPAGERC